MANPNSTDSCIACKFFITGGQLGACHRYPQSLNKSPSDWCGEFIFAKVVRTKDEIDSESTINPATGLTYQETKELAHLITKRIKI
jgi:hypothetical protein